MKKGVAAVLAALIVCLTCLVPVAAAADEPAGEGYGTQWIYYGDLDASGQVNASDALSVLKISVGKIIPDAVQSVVGNVNKDQAINASDALLILQYSVGRITQFPAGNIYTLTPAPEPSTPDGPSEPEPEPQPVDIMSYDKSNAVNGAYIKDATADTSFSVDVSSLSPNTIYRLAANVVTPSADCARLIYSLQGLINRDFGMDADHTVLVYAASDGSDGGWYNIVTADGEIMSDLQMVPVRTWDDFYEIFRDVIASCGLILWDGNVPATSNLAATICGLDGYLPVLANSPLHKQLEDDGILVKQTLVGLFADGQTGKITGTTVDSTGSAKNDAYLWALEKYFSRCTSDYLAYILDGAITLKNYDAYPDHPTALLGGNSCLPNMDYIIARRVFCFDLAVYKGEAACDDPAQQEGLAPIGLDHETMMKIFAARYARADGKFGQMLGFPPWWVKYTTHKNQGIKGDVWNEWLFCEYITCYNMAKEADAQAPASMTNGSVYYKYVPHTSQYTNNHTKQNLTYDSNVFYYTIYVGDYDSSAWLKQHIYEMWVKNGGDKYRGTLPLMWSINPNLSYRVPMIFDYMYEHMTDMDYFAAGDGGAGYIMPSGLIPGVIMPNMNEARPAAYGSGVDAWVAHSKPFYDRFDMDITGFIINSYIPNMTAPVAACMNQLSPTGSLMNSSGTKVGWYQGTPYVHCYNQVIPGQASAMYRYATNTMTGYNFGAYRTICQSPANISAIVSGFNEYAEGNGKTVQYCDPYTYFDLLRQSGQGVQIQ